MKTLDDLTAEQTTQKTNLNTLVRPDRMVDSRTIAARLGVTHRSTYRLIKTHSEGFQLFGSLRFQIAAKTKTGQEKHVLLNEDQTYFLLTLSKNTAKVVKLKQALVSAFSKLRKAAERRAAIEWQQNRSLGKYSRRKATDSIQRFVGYAKEQGSGYADHYYTNFTRLAHKTAGVGSREEATEDQLALLDTAEILIENTLDEAMGSEVPYKLCYPLVKDRLVSFGALVSGGEA